MFRLALTGGIACGKSRAGALICASGIPVCESDELARKVMSPGSDVSRRIIDRFGRSIDLGNGIIDRLALSRKVFGDRSSLDALNSIVHPNVIRMWNTWLAAREKEGARASVVVVPLLFEIHDEHSWDAVICVAAPFAVQLSRLRKRGLSGQQALQRIGAQLPVQEKMDRSDMVVFNGSTIGLMETQVARVMRAIMEMQNG